MAQAKKILKYFYYIVIVPIAVIFFFLGFAIELAIFFDPIGMASSSCADDGNIWDSVHNVCRDDCMMWSEETGCVPLHPEFLRRRRLRLPTECDTECLELYPGYPYG